MTRFIPLIDNNNKTVLQWTMIDSVGVETVKSVPKTLWKLQKDWSESEIKQFFDVKTAAEPVEEDLEDRLEDLEDIVEDLKEHVEKKSSSIDY